MSKGAIHIFTGEGKGKTTAALGLAWKAVAEGRKVFMVQFLKAPDTSGEHFAAQAYPDLLTIRPMGRKGFIRKRGCDPLDAVLAEMALEEAREAMFSGEYDVVILDEVNVAVYMGLLEPDALVELVYGKPENVDLVLTGRYAHPQVVRRADNVIEMKKVKHHYDTGAPAQEGIEY